MARVVPPLSGDHAGATTSPAEDSEADGGKGFFGGHAGADTRTDSL